MTPSSKLPAVGFALPINSENRWVDLLAALIATDASPIGALLDLDVAPDSVTVEREVVLDAANRLDLVLRANDETLAVIEAKVLSGLGTNQLLRYEEALPGASRYAVLFPEHLIVDISRSENWRAITWEQVLDAHINSDHPWVHQTAMAWRKHLEQSLPHVDGSTRWNGLTDGEPFVVAMRARASWVYANLHPPAGVEHDLVTSAAGASAVVRVLAPARVPGYRVIGEVEERLGVRSIPKFADREKHPLVGPSVRVALVQYSVDTSAGFDWDYLLSMWPSMAAARDDWVRRRPAVRAPHDKANYQAMIAKGGPPFLGTGFGEAQTKISRSCSFGARFQLEPDISLADLVTVMESTADLVLQMASVSGPT